MPAPQHIRGILQSLALVGIWTSQFISLSNNSWVNFGEITIYEKRLKNTQGRSDMLMPWAGWCGSLKIDEEKQLKCLENTYKEVFLAYLIDISALTDSQFVELGKTESSESI